MRNFIQIALIVVFAVLFINQCSITKQNEINHDQNISALKDSLSFTKNKLGQEVADKLAFKGSEKELKKILDIKESENSQLRVSMLKWKQIASAVKVETETKIDTVYIPFDKPIPFEFNRSFKKVDTWYSIFGNVTNKGISIDNIFIPNTQTIVSGKKKIGFLKTEYRFEVTNSNPHVKTTNADVYNFTERNKRFGIGVSVGIGVFYKNAFISPLSINYNLIQW